MTEQEHLNSLKPAFAMKVKTVLEDLRSQGYRPKIYESLRTVEQQREKLRRGVSKTMRSKHLTGEAVDIADEKLGWNAPKQFWLALASSALRHGLKSGILFGLGVVQRQRLKGALLGQDYDKANRLPTGWDSAHVETQ